MLRLSAVDGDWRGAFDWNGEAGQSCRTRVEVDGVLATNHLVTLSFCSFGSTSGWSGLGVLVVDQVRCCRVTLTAVAAVAAPGAGTKPELNPWLGVHPTLGFPEVTVWF